MTATGPQLQRWYATSEGSVLYGVFDAAASEEVLPELRRSGQELLSLFEEKGEPVLTEAAPHLVMLDPEAGWGQSILQRGWGRRWAIFLRAPVHAQLVRQQLRRLLQAELPDGRRVMFRFYDPRILRVYLPTCTTAELDTFFGPIQAFYAFREDQSHIDVFRRSDDGSLVVETGSTPLATTSVEVAAHG